MFVLFEKYLYTKDASYDLNTWHKILGHCNESDIEKLPKSVKGMKIKPIPNYTHNYDMCIQGKMIENSKTLDQKATESLWLIHCDLAGSIQSPGKDYKYVLNFIDEFRPYVIFLKT